MVLPRNALPSGLIHALPNAQFGRSVQKLHFCLRSLDLVQLAEQFGSLQGKKTTEVRAYFHQQVVSSKDQPVSFKGCALADLAVKSHQESRHQRYDQAATYLLFLLLLL